MQDTLGFDIILGRAWMNFHDVRLAPKKKTLYIYYSSVRVRSNKGRKRRRFDITEASAKVYATYAQRAKKDKRVLTFAALIANIKKALAPKKKVVIDGKLPT